MKFLSSIFSFDTVNFKSPRFFSLTMLYLVIGYSFIEIPVRYLSPDGQYPTGSWRNNELRVKTSQLEELEKVDIMFTGSSLCASNIPPEEFDKEMKKKGINFTSFNAGIRGSDYEGIAEGFKKLFWERRQSKYVVLVLSPFDIDESNLGVRERTQAFIENLKMPFYEALALDFFSEASWFFGFRNEIREFIFSRKWLYDEAHNGVRGYSPLEDQQGPKVTETKLKIDRNGIIVKSLFNFISWLRKQNVKVIIVEGIMYSLQKKGLNQEEMEKFYEILKELNKMDGVILLNTGNITPDDKHFIDPIHLNLEGGRIYARGLVNNLLEVGFPY